MILNKLSLLLLILFFSSAGFTSEQSYKLRIIKKEERELFGGLGPSTSSLGCAFNLYINENPVSSLTFKCGAIDKFKEDWLYVYSKADIFWVCPKKSFSKDDCLKCLECNLKIDLIKKMSMP